MSSMFLPRCNRLMKSWAFSCVDFTIGALRRSWCFLLSSCTLASYIFSALFMFCVVSLSAPLRATAGFFFNSFRALTSLSAGQVVFGFSYFVLGMLRLNIFQVALKGNRVLNLGYPSWFNMKRMWSLSFVWRLFFKEFLRFLRLSSFLECVGWCL